MNVKLLKWLYHNMLGRLAPGSPRPLHTVEEKLDFLLFNLKEMMCALATDGTQESMDRFMDDD